MIISVPRERKQGEKRVAITPEGAKKLTAAGHRVLIEKDAGMNSGFTNEMYSLAHATIIPTLKEIWEKAELLVKVKEPAVEEWQFFREGLSIFCFLHHAAFPELTNEMLKAKVIGFDYDLLSLDDGRLPILEPMSVIAGKLSIQCGAASLQAGSGGRGVLLGGTSTVAPAKVVVIGAGAAGSNAAWVAYGMGAEVIVLDINSSKLEPFKNISTRLKPIVSSKETLEKECRDADLVIGSVLIPGDSAPKLITRKILSGMKPGSVLVDICIDQGGISETSRSTSIAEPTYIEEGVVHYCVPNMPALVPRTSTQALTSETITWILELADKGLEKVMAKDSPLRRSLTVWKGDLTNEVIGKALKLPFIPTSQLY